jgi:uncharacterized phage infection (PIP) family protein YhgE
MHDARDMSHPGVESRLASPGLLTRVWGLICATIVALAALVVTAGCATAGTNSPGTATATTLSKPCQRLAEINQTLTQLAEVGDNTTVGEVKAIQQKLTTVLDALDKLPGTEGSALNKLQAANDQLTEAIKDLPDSATVGQVGPRFQDFKGKVSQAQAASAKLASALHCTT